MSYSVNFGTFGRKPPASNAGGTFRLAILGDFSGRASRGELKTGEALAAVKPLKVDIDNLDDLVKRLKIQLQLPIAADGGTVKIPINSIDDFHPDQLYDNVSVFGELSGLRMRLKTNSTFAKAAEDMKSWPNAEVASVAARAKPRSAAVPVNGKLSDFAQLVGKPTATQPEAPIKNLLQQIVGPHVVAAKDPAQAKLVAAVDEAISDTMRTILHHPDFQTLEAMWRAVDFLVRRLETDNELQIILYDISAEEFAADLSSATSLDESGLYRLLIDQPALNAQEGPLSAIVGMYFFEQTPPHAELLGRMAKIAAAGQAPFLTSLSADTLKQLNPKDLHPLVMTAWNSLCRMPEAVYLGLTMPRFMLRSPYGARTESIDKFNFEEFTPQIGIRAMLWGNSALLAGLLLGQTYKAQGLKKMNLGSVMGVGEMPYYFYEDADGDQVALPCTERLINVKTAGQVTGRRFIPVLGIKNRPEVRLGSFQSLAAKPIAGPWAPVVITFTEGEAPPAAPTPAPVVEAPTPAATPISEAPAPVAAAPPEPAASVDAELDALLAGLGGDDSAPAAADDSGDIDAGLAALLADL